MKKAGWAKKRFLIDGFPRNEENYLGFVDVMGGDVNMEKVLFFEADEETLV
jgi:histone-lysine N-methyltransferase SETD2/UMP-CMP kinase